MTMHHADHRHRVHHVGRRADHRARDRQRHLAHHLRRHRHGIPQRHRPATSRRTRATSSRSTSPRWSPSSSRTVAAIVFFERGAAADPDRLRAPQRRPTRLRRPDGAPAAQGEHGRHDPADLRLVAPDVPGDARELQDPGHAEPPGDAPARRLALQHRSTSLLIIFFCYFYTAVTFQPVDVADNLKKQQAIIPSIRQGKQTADYIDRVLTRITLRRRASTWRSSASCRSIISAACSTSRSAAAAPSIMIVVGVALDTVNQIEAHLITRNYEGLTGPAPAAIRGTPRPRGRLSDAASSSSARRARAKARRPRSSARATASRRSRPATCSARRRRRARSDKSSSTMMARAGSSRTRWSSASSRSASQDARLQAGLPPRRLPAHGAAGRGARRAARAKRGPELERRARRSTSPRDLLVERPVLRRTDKRTGQIYHFKYNPPPPGAELGASRGRQRRRVGKRLDAYEAMTAALLPYYEKQGLLRRVDGVGEPSKKSRRECSRRSDA